MKKQISVLIMLTLIGFLTRCKKITQESQNGQVTQTIALLNSPDISSWRARAKSFLPVPASPRTITEFPAAIALTT
jgi:type III secretory pathway lipoprotein EscJ